MSRCLVIRRPLHSNDINHQPLVIKNTLNYLNRVASIPNFTVRNNLLLTNNFAMLEVKYNIKSLISSIYECQKKIIINRRFIRELESEGQSTAHLVLEIKELEGQILDYQKELRKKYQFSY